MSFQELVPFLESPSPHVLKVALENVLPLTPASAGKAFIFKDNDFRGLRALKKLSIQSEDPWNVQNALIALINLTDDDVIRSELAGDAKFVRGIAQQATVKPKPRFVKYSCMLLNNMSKNNDTLGAIRGPILTELILTTSNPANISDEDYDFLTFTFSEFARQDASAIAKDVPYLYTQLQSESVNRRQGVASTIKNSLFNLQLHEPFAVDTPLIEAIMIRLKGPEPMDEKDFAQLPVSVKRECSEKKMRETENSVIHLLLESLLLLSSSQVGRDALRQKHAYFVVRELHRATSDTDIKEACENYANMVLRGDPSQSVTNNKTACKISEIGNDEDNGVKEVV